MNEKREIDSFNETLQVLMVVLDQRMKNLVSACEDWGHTNPDSGDMKEIRGSLNDIISDIFSVKQAKAIAQYHTRPTIEMK